MQTPGLKAEHLSGIDFNAELKRLATGNDAFHGYKGRGESTGHNGPRGYNYNGSKQGSRDERSLGQDTEEHALVTSKEEVFGFVDKEGNIYLDEINISLEYPIHEYTHLWSYDNISIETKNEKAVVTTLLQLETDSPPERMRP